MPVHEWNFKYLVVHCPRDQYEFHLVFLADHAETSCEEIFSPFPTLRQNLKWKSDFFLAYPVHAVLNKFCCYFQANCCNYVFIGFLHYISSPDGPQFGQSACLLMQKKKEKKDYYTVSPSPQNQISIVFLFFNGQTLRIYILGHLISQSFHYGKEPSEKSYF